MRLLMVAFAIDDNSGALAWQAELARQLHPLVDHLSIVCEDYDPDTPLPAGVDLLQLPARPLGVPRRLGGRWAFNRHVYALCRRNRVDAVLVHMCHEWAYRLWPVFRFLGLPVVCWYAHGAVSRRLAVAARCVDTMITSTPEGCRIAPRRVRVIGQAIDTGRFRIPNPRTLERMVFMGRVSARKRIDRLLATMRVLRERGTIDPLSLDIVGPLLTDEDRRYDHELHAKAAHEGLLDHVRFHGFVPGAFLPRFYEQAFLHPSLSATGSMDKTTMEALASGCPVLVSSEAFFEILSEYPEFIVRDERPEAIADQIEHIHARRYDYDPEKLRALVTHGHSMTSYPERILEVLGEIRKRKDTRSLR